MIQDSLLEKLRGVESRYEEVNLTLQNPNITGDQKKFRDLTRELSQLTEIVTCFRLMQSKAEQRGQNLELFKDPDLSGLAKEENKVLDQQILSLEEQLKLLLLPKDPHDEKNIILEIRAGAGGDEASLFADELARAYAKYADGLGWRVERMSYSEGNVGGAKEIVARISGDKVFSRLKFESGVHRVQRVPKTEAQGRVHTSTVTVAVIPEQEVSEVKLNMNEIRIDVTRSQGSGGQSVNTTDSAVRATHLPTGIIVFCQQGKSQQMNKEIALQILYSKLCAIEDEKRIKEASDARLAQIGTGDRSERIRTYNFPQSRITDHRINLTTHAISEVMNGKLETLIDPLIAHHQSELLSGIKPT